MASAAAPAASAGQCKDPGTGTCECPDGQHKCGRTCCDRSRTCCGEGDTGVCCSEGSDCCEVGMGTYRAVCCPPGTTCVTHRGGGFTDALIVCCPSQQACRGQCCPPGQVCIGELACCPRERATSDRRGCCDPGFRSCGKGCCPTSVFGGYECRNGQCICRPGQECGAICCPLGTVCREGRCQRRPLRIGPPR